MILRLPLVKLELSLQAIIGAMLCCVLFVGLELDHRMDRVDRLLNADGNQTKMVRVEHIGYDEAVDRLSEASEKGTLVGWSILPTRTYEIDTESGYEAYKSGIGDIAIQVTDSCNLVMELRKSVGGGEE